MAKTRRIPKCDQCDSATLNGFYCHEHGCPNINKIYDFETESWQYPENEIEVEERDSDIYDEESEDDDSYDYSTQKNFD